MLGVVAVVLLALAALLATIGVDWVVGRMQAEQTPPEVLVHHPDSGSSFFPGTIVTVRAEAWGSTRIARLALWVDGKSIEEQRNPGLEGLALTAEFEYDVPEGPHILVVRAVDEQGFVGQSLPLSILGDPLSGSGPSVMNWPAQPGDTLPDLADRLALDEDELRDANPTLGDGNLAAGTVVQIPVPPDGAGAPSADVIFPEPIQVDPPAGPRLELITTADLIRGILRLRQLLLPKAPDGMEATYRDCTVILGWKDNSEYEEHFAIWMAGLGQAGRIVARATASPGTGPVWVQFEAPRGGIYSFWVEAVNATGSQPSPPGWVFVPFDDACSPSLATHLLVELDRLSVPGNYDSFYCYVSANGLTPTKFPPGDGIFIELLGENILIGGRLSFEVPIPDPRVLTLEGECHGWIGREDLVNLGPFETSVPEAEWDGRELLVDTGTYRFTYSVLTKGQMQVSSMVQSQYDLTLPAPYDLRLTKETLPIALVKHTLHWRWDGNPNDITGYTIYVDDKEFAVTEDTSRSVLIPTDCGKTIRFRVAANSEEATSIPSEELTHSTTPCAVSARVEFLSLNIYGEVDDEYDCFLGFFPAENCSSYGKECEGYQAVGRIFAQGTSYQMVEIGSWGGNIELYWPVNCYGQATFYPHSLALMSEGKNIFTVPLNPANPALQIGVKFWDLDVNPDDVICTFDSAELDLPFSHLTAEEWPSYDETLEIDCSAETEATIVVRVTGVK